MNIAYFLTSLSNSGPINVAMDLVQVMQHHGHHCEVYYFKDKFGNKFDCPTHKISMITHIDFSQYDVIHSHGFLPDLYLLIHLPYKKNRPVYFSTIHSFIFQDHLYKYGKLKSFFTTRLTIAATKRADKVITLGHEAMRHYEGYISEKRLTWAYNTRIIKTGESIDFEDKMVIQSFRNKVGRIVGAVCGIHTRKGLDQVVRAMAMKDDYGFLIIGDGLMRKQLEKLASDIGVRDRILFLGSRREGYRYLNEMDVFVLPSRSEGFPLSLLEAAAMSKASIISDIPVFKEIFTPEEVGMFHIENVDSFNKELERVFSDLYGFGRRLNTRYQKNYSSEAFYNRHMQIYTGKTYI